jgi:hypothetical protein
MGSAWLSLFTKTREVYGDRYSSRRESFDRAVSRKLPVDEFVNVLSRSKKFCWRSCASIEIPQTDKFRVELQLLG